MLEDCLQNLDCSHLDYLILVQIMHHQNSYFYFSQSVYRCRDFLIDQHQSNFLRCLLKAKADAQRCSIKKCSSKFLQDSQENTCARVSFLIKLQALGLKLYFKKGSGAGVFL